MKNLNQTIKDIEFARKIHKEWVKVQIRSKNRVENVGDVEWHKKWIKIYNNTLYFLKRKSG